MIKKLLYSLFFIVVFVAQTKAQIFDPVNWSARVESKDANAFELKISATIDAKWHLYAQNIAPGGPIPTKFDYPDAPDKITLVGKTLEPDGIENFDAVFEMPIKFFENQVTFSQVFELRDPALTQLTFEVTYMACDDEKCLPPTSEIYVVPLDGSASFEQKNSDETPARGLPNVFQNSLPSSTNESAIEKKPQEFSSLPIDTQQGLWSIFFIAFLSGFAALLTPCVFPMIPLTVSYFTKRNAQSRGAVFRDALFYGLSIIGIYVLLGTLVTAVFGADALNIVATNVWFNLAFFALLVIFALSFLGAFEIVLPTSWANMADRQADKKGLLGMVFMALALAIVSFSCTGPIVGTLLVQAASQGGWAPAMGMLGFSTALALPFMVFALFPKWMQSLPKSGGWMQTVKVTLGFLELALAFKFLSNADLVMQKHWLERELFLAIWIAIFVALSLYLLGILKLTHDSGDGKISTGRLGFGLLTLSFTLYLIPGLWGAPLKIISGFPPPSSYSEAPNGFFNSVASPQLTHPDMVSGPHGIQVFKDYQLALDYAIKVNKPLMVDFTGHACVNCRKMEDFVWSDPAVTQILNKEVVLVSLYVDEQINLPENEQYVSPETGRKVKTVGNKWSDFQISRYKTNAQPYYLLLNHQEELLNQPVGYVPDVETFKNWLKAGINAF